MKNYLGEEIIWKSIENNPPPENEFVYLKSDKFHFIIISRLIDGEWELGLRRKESIFDKKQMEIVSKSFMWWTEITY